MLVPKTFHIFFYIYKYLYIYIKYTWCLVDFLIQLSTLSFPVTITDLGGRYNFGNLFLCIELNANFFLPTFFFEFMIRTYMGGYRGGYRGGQGGIVKNVKTHACTQLKVKLMKLKQLDDCKTYTIFTSNVSNR